MIRALLQDLTRRLPPPRIIFDRTGVSPYLSRWYLVGAPTMPDGSHPFERDGRPKEGIVWSPRRWGLYLHRFHRGDSEPELHNHPWRWALSLILAGGYQEERRDPDDVVRMRHVLPFSVNRINADDFHRVDLYEEDAWSLFLVGPKFQGWGFWNRDTDVFLPWREFIDGLRDPTAFAREAAS